MIHKACCVPLQHGSNHLGIRLVMPLLNRVQEIEFQLTFTISLRQYILLKPGIDYYHFEINLETIILHLYAW